MSLPKPYYDHAGITIYHGDCREILPHVSGADVVVTDPPYVFGIASSHQESKAGGWGDLMNSASFYAGLLREFRRITENRNGAAWVFNSWRSFPVLCRAAYEARWPIESLLVWDKEWIGPGGQRGLRPSYEVAALFCSGAFSFSDRGQPDVMRCKWHPGSKETEHPAEKPVPLLRRLIEQSAPTGALVIDPFCGSGSTLRAASDCGRRAIGIEIEERYCEIAAKRLAQEVLFPAEVKP